MYFFACVVTRHISDRTINYICNNMLNSIRDVANCARHFEKVINIDQIAH